MRSTMETKYNVFFTGKIIDGFDKSRVWENLSKVYGNRCDDLKLEAFFTGRMIILSRNLKYEDADNILDIFENAGLDCVAVPDEVEEPLDKLQLNGDYNLIYTGVLKDGYSIDKVRENLSNFYGRRGSDQLIYSFFTGKQILLMKKININAAKMNLALFEGAGLKCVIEPMKEGSGGQFTEKGRPSASTIEDIEDIVKTNEEDSLKVFVDSGKSKTSVNADAGKIGEQVIQKTPSSDFGHIDIPSHLVQGKRPEPTLKPGFIKADKKITEEEFCRNCKGSFNLDQEIARCSKCGSYYDRPCWEKNGGCIQSPPQCDARHAVTHKNEVSQRSGTRQKNEAGQKTGWQASQKKILKVEIDQSNKDVRAAIIAGLISGIMTMAVVIASILSHYNITGLGYGMYTLLDIAVIYILSLGIYMRSRICAIILFLYFVSSRVYIVIETGQIPVWFIVFLFGYFYYLGIRGTINYHKSKISARKK